MIRFCFALVLLAGLTLSAGAADIKYALTGENTKIGFTGTKKNGKHDGGFKTLTGSATVTDKNAESLKIEVEIDCGSLFSDNGKLTDHLKNPDFFDVKNHPKATFKSTKVAKADKVYNVTGELKMLGKTETITFPATVAATDDTVTLNATFAIDRTKWGMNYGKGMIDDKVTLTVAVTAKK